jgi:uncharacterized protein (UPF0305 family)
MKASALFLLIKNDQKTLSAYKSQIELKMSADKNNNSISSIMTRYNYDNFIEILNPDSLDSDFEVDDAKLKDFQHRIDSYLNIYVPDDVDLKTYVKGISTYLAFIAKRPLHPPGLEFANGARIIKKGNSYYCSGKRQFIKDDLSLCKFCVCKQLH